MAIARGDRGHAARKPGDADGPEAVVLSAVAELPVHVVAPALDPALAREGAGVKTTGADRRHAAR